MLFRSDIDNPTPSSSTRAIYSNAGGLNWLTTGGTYVRSGLSTELSGFTAFGDFVVGTPYASPGIVSQMGPTDSTNVGIATSFTITASGSYPQYQWQKNGVNLSNGGAFSGVNTATLTVTPINVSDAGNYQCIVTGSCGNAAYSGDVALTVFNKIGRAHV